ncbi:MAG TPA: UDP-N-acetylmuramoyl-tripeptide--D-alanyl-D-alanine ligase [Methylophilaceae bacterium]|nr:UDP-N-acetylmuramoyl-tripeptide--D-alanyl-D-alanine ligase [Methylophilaceae bacterium]
MMKLSEAAMAVQGKLNGADVTFTDVSTDSRSIATGQLFVALRGEHFDGHAYARECLEKGAAAVMLDEKGPVEQLQPSLLVADTRLALGQLASYWRGKFHIPLAAITGSNGKTTVKEMLAAILRVAAGGEEYVLSTQGNLNNDIGLPLTLFRLTPTHRYAVAEMGMNHAGEISYLTRLAKPTVALVNNATAAHLHGLGSVEAIARAKGEIFEGLAADGTAIINADDAFADFWRGLTPSRKILTFGLKQKADVTATYQLGTESSELKMYTPHGEVAFTLPVAGLHNVSNALAATAAAVAMGVALSDIASGLVSFGGVKGRLQRKTGFNGALVIDDTYNANPASMKAAIDVLKTRSGTRLLVLGDMGELGADAASMHAEIGRYANQVGIDALFTLGDLSREMAKAFGLSAKHYETAEALAADLKSRMDTTTTVLVKGSRFMRMERVVNLILREQQEGVNNAA